jgi:hypothetical protein
MAGHPGEDELERYAMETCPPARAEAIEEHLLLCEPCRARLAGIDSFLLSFRAVAAGMLDDLHYRHRSGESWVDVVLSRAGSRWTARISGPDVEFERVCETLQDAFTCSRQTFRELFPEHRCGRACGPAAGVDEP